LADVFLLLSLEAFYSVLNDSNHTKIQGT